MKITIDTTFKPHRVEIEGDCAIGELIEFLSKYYPDFTWKDIRIGGKITFTQGFRTTSPNIQPFIQPNNPWTQPNTGNPWIIGDIPGQTIIYCSDTNTAVTSSGTSVDLNQFFNEKGTKP